MSFPLGLFLGALASALAAVPAALRAEASLSVWLVLAGAAALATGPALGGLARARPLSEVARAALAGLGLAALPLALLAYRLRIGTHHRPLGAVTFVVVAAFVLVLGIAVAGRVLSGTRGANEVSQRGVWVRRALLAISLAGPLLLTFSVTTTGPGRVGLFDVALCLGLSALALLLPWPAAVLRLGSKLGLWVWLALVVLGVFASRGPAGVEAEAASPALLSPIRWSLR